MIHVKRKLKWIWFNIKCELPAIIISLMLLALFSVIIYETIDMVNDHQCYIDGHYDTPECRKYIRED